MDNEWLTVSEAADALGIPNDSLRRYLRLHGDWLKIRKDGRSYRIHVECQDILRKIREAYEQNRSSDEINALLSQTQPLTVHVTDERANERKLMTVDDAIQAQMNMLRGYERRIEAVVKMYDKKLDSMAEIHNRRIEGLTEEVQLLRTMIRDRDESMNEQIEKTNLLLQEMRQEAERPKKRRGFLAGIFGREGD